RQAVARRGAGPQVGDGPRQTPVLALDPAQLAAQVDDLRRLLRHLPHLLARGVEPGAGGDELVAVRHARPPVKTTASASTRPAAGSASPKRPAGIAWCRSPDSSASLARAAPFSSIASTRRRRSAATSRSARSAASSASAASVSARTASSSVTLFL